MTLFLQDVSQYLVIYVDLSASRFLCIFITIIYGARWVLAGVGTRIHVGVGSAVD